MDYYKYNNILNHVDSNTDVSERSERYSKLGAQKGDRGDTVAKWIVIGLVIAAALGTAAHFIIKAIR